jgi:shikimate dehydrogenase
MAKLANAGTNTAIQLGIVGHPLGHTLSPVLHQFLLQQSGLTGAYTVYDTPDLVHALNQLTMRGVTGFNVTIPHKVGMLAYCDQLSDNAKRIQAVNTVKRVNGQWHGDNTDCTGYINALPPLVKNDLHRHHCLVLGAGGAARAVLAGLMGENVPSITVVARTQAKADALVALANSWKPAIGFNTRLHALTFEDLTQQWSHATCIINTTPVGTKDAHACPIDPDLLHALPADAYVSDLVYNPIETCLVAEARAAGYQADTGLGMLVHQGVLAFEYWTGATVPTAVIDEALAVLTAQL